MTSPRAVPGWRPLAGVLASSGVLHLVRPGPFASIVPRWLGDPVPWVHGSGVAEIACAVGLALPRTRRVAALSTAALFVAVFPANVQMAVTALRSERASTAFQVVALARLPLQVPLVLWALRVRRRSS
ncbi:DoxX family protein [Angustibacter aerolatus]|uniref:Membrane protein n=1 Tax=Angustibacter aerolatus TaxID=1162965 RepID=A0ABQ6JBR5_9ACTN|nr:DoxX family protein [Angustibacter aerolatus]GMA85237.1 membrane protein [Angustibacter aerolatus]